jgi:predicted  nucleic acid-binding Zn-ribbon protein
MRTEATKLDEQRGQEMRRLAQLQNEHDELQRETESKVQQLQAERAEAAEGVPPTVLQTFERVSERYDGEAMAMVVRTNPRREEFICQGCNMTVTLEKVNALITRDEVQQCQTCGRLLFLEQAATRQRT